MPINRQKPCTEVNELAGTPKSNSRYNVRVRERENKCLVRGQGRILSEYEFAHLFYYIEVLPRKMYISLVRLSCSVRTDKLNESFQCR